MNPIQQFILENLRSHPRDITKVVMNHFKVTRGAVNFHLNKLKEAGVIVQEGTRNKSVYSLNESFLKEEKASEKSFWYVVGERDEYDIWKNDIRPVLGGLLQNVEEICSHGFTEIFNNVIDHSNSSQAVVVVNVLENEVHLEVQDFGVGVFRKIAQFFHIQDLREAVVRLHQGKITTDRSRHSGEGIFYTSRAFDEFILLANGFAYFKENDKEDEWYFERQNEKEVQSGTYVKMCINKKSTRRLKDVFDKYTNPEDYRFDKSHIRIELGKFEEDRFVSRSQAKRLLTGLRDFRTIILDFKNIKNVGQAFVDEVFGVYGTENSRVNFEIVNANEDILFMIKRGLAERNFSFDRVNFI